jgi:hypothetical protein
MAENPRKHLRPRDVQAARSVAAALANPAAGLPGLLAGAQTALARLAARPPLLAAAPFGSLPAAPLPGAQPPPAAAPVQRSTAGHPSPAADHGRPATPPRQNAGAPVASGRRTATPGPPRGQSAGINRPDPEPPFPGSRRAAAGQPGEKPPRAEAAASLPKSAAGLQLPVFGGPHRRAAGSGSVAPESNFTQTAVIPAAGSLTMVTDALFNILDGADAPRDRAAPVGRGTPPAAAAAPLPDRQRDGDRHFRPARPAHAPTAAESARNPLSGAPVGPARAPTAMARIATLVEVLLAPSGKAPPRGAADPVLRVAAPPAAPAALEAGTAAAIGPPGQRAPTGPASSAGPRVLPDTRRWPEVTEPEDLAELINDVLVDQARRHGVNLS